MMEVYVEINDSEYLHCNIGIGILANLHES